MEQIIRMQMIRSAPIVRGGIVRGGPAGWVPGAGVAALLVPVVLLAGCSSAPSTIDGAKLEQKLRDDFASAGTPATAVECPRDRPARQGDTFSCQVTLGSGSAVRYDVVLSDDQGHYTYAVAPGQVLDGEAAAGLLTTDIASSSSDLADAKVTCPKTVLAPGGQARFDCQVVTGGSSATITVTAAPSVPLDWQFKA
jgi:hypothetical protein